jgi:hypothetical protein
LIPFSIKCWRVSPSHVPPPDSPGKKDIKSIFSLPLVSS